MYPCPSRTLTLTLTRPGWGGSYAGSKPRCFASHDMGKKAQPEACHFDKPFSISESWEPQGKFPSPHPKDTERGEKWVKRVVNQVYKLFGDGHDGKII